MVGAITDKQRSPPRHESGHRCGSHGSMSAVDTTRGGMFSGGHLGHSSGRAACRDEARRGAIRVASGTGL